VGVASITELETVTNIDDVDDGCITAVLALTEVSITSEEVGAKEVDDSSGSTIVVKEFAI